MLDEISCARQTYDAAFQGSHGAFSEDAIRGPWVLALAEKVKYVVDPRNPYPANYTGHIRATMKDGGVVEERQPHLRGGAHEPLSRQATAAELVM